jgi:hypothetical protein
VPVRRTFQAGLAYLLRTVAPQKSATERFEGGNDL